MKTSFIFLLIILFLNIPSVYYGWYITWWWVDTLMHYFGGLFMGMFMFYYLKDRIIVGEWIKNALIVVGAALFIGVVWEFSEYVANQTLVDWVYNTFQVKAYFMGDLNDTVIDLLMDTLGALSFLVIHSFWSRESKEV